jgi:hypothetical protein
VLLVVLTWSRRLRLRMWEALLALGRQTCPKGTCGAKGELMMCEAIK